MFPQLYQRLQAMITYKLLQSPRFHRFVWWSESTAEQIHRKGIEKSENLASAIRNSDALERAQQFKREFIQVVKEEFFGRKGNHP